MTNGLTNVAPNVSRTTAHVQNNHHKYMTETKLALQKHTTTVHALRQEREDLLRELGSAGLGTTMNLMDTAKSASSHSGSGSPNNTIDLRRKATQHREEIRLLKIKLDAEQKRTQELEKNIAVLQGEQFATRAVMGGVNVRKENYQLFEKQMKVLENRLDQSLVRFNDTIAHNKQLRETIDTLRREREVFNEIYAKLERELQDKKFHMSDTIEVSNRCYETRDGYVAELERLRITAQDELTSFNHKLRDLDAEAALILSKEAAMEEEKEQAVARIKAQRVAAAAAAAATVSLGTLPAVNKSLAGSAPSDPTNNTSGNGNNVNLGATEALPAVDPQVAIRHYQEMLEQLREATGVQDMKKLQEKFRSVEESNFSMYNYIHSLNKEIEGIEDEIESLRESMDGDKGDPATRRALQELEEELAQTEGIQHAYQEKNRAIRNELHVLVSILRDVMSNTGAIAAMTTASDPTNESEPSTTPIPNEITERNMGVFLAALERHAMAYVQRQQLANHRSRLAEKEATAATTATAAGTAPDDSDSITARRRSQYEEEGRAPPRLGTSSGNVHQLMTSHGLPSTGDGFGNDGEDGDDDRVLSEKELRERIERRFLAKEMNGGDRAERKKGKGAGIKR